MQGKQKLSLGKKNEIFAKYLYIHDHVTCRKGLLIFSFSVPRLML